MERQLRVARLSQLAGDEEEEVEIVRERDGEARDAETGATSTKGLDNGTTKLEHMEECNIAGVASKLFLLTSTPQARADIEDDYKIKTQKVIGQVHSTLGMDKADPTRGEVVKSLHQTSNKWVAKYRREKRFANKPSYSKIYSILNAVSGHFISYGDGAPLLYKRCTQILEEVDIAERALGRGR
ncbi:hypothetical protein L7F22_026878 [Adiantum nelumboides]|nr:hypothetical protein [Adiantum nelumboides]